MAKGGARRFASFSLRAGHSPELLASSLDLVRDVYGFAEGEPEVVDVRDDVLTYRVPVPRV